MVCYFRNHWVLRLYVTFTQKLITGINSADILHLIPKQTTPQGSFYFLSPTSYNLLIHCLMPLPSPVLVVPIIYSTLNLAMCAY